MYNPSARLAELLSLYLSGFFEKPDSNHLKLSLWQGDLTLQNLRLRKDSLNNVWPDAFLLINEGVIGEIQLKVPWRSLTTGRASLIIRDVKISLCPRAINGPPTPEEMQALEAAAQLAKQRIIEQAEEEFYEKGNINMSPQWWASSLFKFLASSVLLKLLQNLQVDVRNVDVMVHDEANHLRSPSSSLSSSSSPSSYCVDTTATFSKEMVRKGAKLVKCKTDQVEREYNAVGIHVEHVKVGVVSQVLHRPALENDPSPSSSTGFLPASEQQHICKGITIASIGFYAYQHSLTCAQAIKEEEEANCPTDCARPVPSSASNPVLQADLKSMDISQQDRSPHDNSPYWLVKPFDVEFGYRAYSDHSRHDVLQDLDVEIKGMVETHFRHQHYNSLAALRSSVEAARLRLRFWSLRPKASVKESPCAWWRYAKEVVIAETRRQEHLSSSFPCQSIQKNMCTFGRQRTGESFVEDANLRDRYLSCYQKLLEAANATQVAVSTYFGCKYSQSYIVDALTELSSLESELTIEKVLLFRADGRAKAKLDGFADASDRRVWQWLRGFVATSSSSSRDNRTAFGEYTKCNSSNTCTSTITWSSLYTKVHIQHLNLKLDSPKIDHKHILPAFELNIERIQGDLWRTFSKKEAVSIISVESVIGNDTRGNRALSLGTGSDFPTRSANGRPALQLYIGQRPGMLLYETPKSAGKYHASKPTSKTFLEKHQLRRQQLTVEVLTTLVSIDLTPMVMEDLNDFIPGEDVPFRSNSHFKRLRNLAACRRRYSIPTYMDILTRQHVSLNLMLTFDSINTRLRGMSSATGEDEEMRMQVTGLLFSHGKFVNALTYANHGVPGVEKLVLGHNLVQPSIRIQEILRSQSSISEEYSFMCVQSLNVDIPTKTDRSDAVLQNQNVDSKCQLLAQPFVFEAVAATCILPGRPNYPRHRAYVHVSPIEVLLSPRRLQTLDSVLRSLLQLQRKSIERGSDISVRPVRMPPRLFSMSRILDITADVWVHSLVISIDTDRSSNDYQHSPCHDSLPARAGQLLVDTIKTWVHFSNPSEPSSAAWKLALSRMVMAGFSKNSGEMALELVKKGFLSKEFSDLEHRIHEHVGECSSAEDFLDSFAEDVSKRLANILVPQTRFVDRQCPLLRIVAEGLDFSCVKLIHDLRLSVELQRCFVENEGKCEIFKFAAEPDLTSIRSKYQPAYLRTRAPKFCAGMTQSFTRPVEKQRQEHTKERYQDFLNVAQSSAGNCNAVKVTFIKQGHESGWGQGESSLTALRKVELGLITTADSGQDYLFNISLGNAAILLDLDQIALDLDRFHALFTDQGLLSISKHRPAVENNDMLGHSYQKTDPLLPVRKVLNMRMDSASVVFMNEGKTQFHIVLDHVKSDVVYRKQEGDESHGLQLSRCSFSCQDILVEDLAPSGEDYPVVISRLTDKIGDPTSMKPHLPVFCVQYQQGGVSPVLNVHMNDVRLCFTLRFLKLYINIQKKGILPIIQRASRVFETTESRPSSKSSFHVSSATTADRPKWTCQAHNLVIILPRNSDEIDLGALKVRALHISSYQSGTTWRLPEGSDAAYEIDAVTKVSRACPHSQVPEGEYFHSRSARSDVKEMIAIGEEDEDIYFDAEDHNIGRPAWTPFHSATAFNSSHRNNYAVASILTKGDPCLRIQISARDVQVFAAVVNNQTKEEKFTQTRVWAAVNHQESVYKIVDPENRTFTCTEGMLHWEELTKDTTAFDLYWDSLDDMRSRYLLVFLPPTKVQSSAALDLQITMAQLYLLYSIWYDNLSEEARYYSQDDIFAQEAHELATTVSFPDLWPAYDTLDFFERLSDQVSRWDFGLVVPSISLSLRFDCESLLERPPSFFMADNGLRSQLLDVVQLQLENAILKVSGGEGAVKLAFGAKYMQAVDLRSPQRTRQPHFFRCGSATPAQPSICAPYKPVYLDQTFGFTTDLEGVHPTLPLQMTLALTPDNWMCINIGIKDAEALHKDMSLVWLVVDIFSYYFRFPIYGKPDLIAAAPKTTTYGMKIGESPRIRTARSQSAQISGGTDVRVWAVKPCISAPEDPLAQDTATLVLHCGAEYFYRYKGNSEGSYLTRIRGNALSLGLSAGFHAAASIRRLLSEGQWGPNDTESRILVRDLSVDLLYSYDQDMNHVEAQASLPACGKRQTATSHQRRPQDPFMQPEPSAVSPLEKISRGYALPCFSLTSSRQPPCNFMGSYGDIAFIHGTVTNFIGPTVEALANLRHMVHGFYMDAQHRDRSKEGRKKLRSAFLRHFKDAGQYHGTSFPVDSVRQSANDPHSEITIPTISESTLDIGGLHGDQPTCQVTVEVAGLKVLLLDPVLGLHFPFVKLVLGELNAMIYHGPNSDNSSISISSAVLSASNMDGEDYQGPEKEINQTSSLLSKAALGCSPRQPSSWSLNVSLHARLWSDYFNIKLKCWEPLLEPYAFRALYEDANDRGKGLTLRSYCPLHVIVSSALLQTLGHTLRAAEQIDVDIMKFEELYLSIFTTANDAQLHASIFGDSPTEKRFDDAMPESIRDSSHPTSLKHAQMDALPSMPSSTSDKGYLHFKHETPPVLSPGVRTPFSICNLTGEVLRCFQPHAVSNNTNASLQYLEHGVICPLPFGATMTALQNLKPIEVPFDIDSDLFLPDDERGKHATRNSECGKYRRLTLPTILNKSWIICVQPKDYRWLSCVSADALGLQFQSLWPLPGLPHAERLLEDWKIRNAFKLVSEVRVVNGCRQLTLRSVFRVKNCTKHKIEMAVHPSSDFRPNCEGTVRIAAEDEGVDRAGSSLTNLAPDEMYNVPLSLLRLAIDSAAGSGFLQSLGRLWIRPQKWRASMVARAPARHPQSYAEVQFSTESVDLKMLVDESARLFTTWAKNQGDHEPVGEKSPVSLTNNVLQRHTKHLLCPVLHDVDQASQVPSYFSTPSHGTSMASSVSYCVEIIRTKFKKNDVDGCNDDNPITMKDGFQRGAGSGTHWDSKNVEPIHGPLDYMIVIHPPLVLENLLPEACVFRLYDFTSKAMLWKAHLQAGQSMPIHDVRVDCSVLLDVQTEDCRSTESVLIHKGGGALRGMEAIDHDVAKFITMVDAENQKLLLQLEHQVGGAGQRRTILYCPYWLVNNTNCLLTYIQEGKSNTPAGTLKTSTTMITASAVTAEGKSGKEGATKAPSPCRNAVDESYRPLMGFHEINSSWGGIGPKSDHSPACILERDKRRHKQFPGELGLSKFHHKVKGGFRTNTSRMSTHFTDSYGLFELCEASFMFNYSEENPLSLGLQRLKIKVNDSAWSKSFSLDTVGVNQVITVRHPQWGDMEIGFIINLAPGRLGQFTKVVFFCPRYVVWNRHPLPLYLSQDSTYFRLGHISDEIGSHCIAQAHLPRSSEKRVTVQLQGGYDKSAPFLIDEGADLCLRLTRLTDLSRVRHLMTRKNPEFDIQLPPGQEIGIWLETDWNHEMLIVKALKKNRWAEKTEIYKGDVLLAIEGQPITGKDFKKIIAALKGLLATTGATLRFRTQEENLRLLRLRALGQLISSSQQIHCTKRSQMDGPEYITVQLKPIGPCVYVIVGKLDPQVSPPYRIVNRTKNFMIHYRQAGCEMHPWNTLAPHESSIYTWEEPMKSRKLDLRVAPRQGMLGMRGMDAHPAAIRARQSRVSRQGVPNILFAKIPGVRIRLDGIGRAHPIPLHEPYTDDGHCLIARIGTEGTTRVLNVSKDGSADERMSLKRRQEELSKLRQVYVQHRDIYSQLMEELAILAEEKREVMPRDQTKNFNLDAVENAIGGLQAEIHDADIHVRGRHHLLVEVIEAKGLQAKDISGLSDPFVQVYLKIQDKLLRRDPRYQQHFTTYVIEKTLNPKWQNQSFVFKVPPKAVSNPKAYSVHVKVKDFDGPVKKSDFLGRIDMQLDLLENEMELDGWYFLTRKSQLFQQPLQSCLETPDLGAIHLRMRWVHSLEGLVHNLKDWTEGKLQDLEVQQQHLGKEEMEQAGESNHLTPEPGLMNHQKENLKLRTIETQIRGATALRQRQRSGAVESIGEAFSRQADDSLRLSPAGFRKNCPQETPLEWKSLQDHRDKSISLTCDHTTGSPSLESTRDRMALIRLQRRKRMSHPVQYCNKDAQRPNPYDGRTQICSYRSLSSPECLAVSNLASLKNSGTRFLSFVRSASKENPPQTRSLAIDYFHDLKRISRRLRTQSTRHVMAMQHCMARRSFEQEAARSHRCVNNPGGTLHIRPFQALNLGDKAKRSYVTVRYGLHVERTTKAKPGAYPRWDVANAKNELTLEVEHLNTTGTIHVTVWSEQELQDVELAHIDMPLGSLIDCCDDNGNYVRWFPLLHSVYTRSEQGNFLKMPCPWTSEKESIEDFISEPCLKLGFRWIPSNENNHIFKTNGYLRAYLTEISISMVDSYKCLELMSMTVRSIEARYVDNPALTRASMVVSHVQFDNQLPDAEAPVIFGPTPMQMPQPFLQCSLFRQKDRNQIMRPDRLCRLKYVFILFQEVDLKVEEAFVHALWQSFSRVLVDHLVTSSTLSAQLRQEHGAGQREARATSEEQARQAVNAMTYHKISKDSSPSPRLPASFHSSGSEGEQINTQVALSVSRSRALYMLPTESPSQSEAQNRFVTTQSSLKASTKDGPDVRLCGNGEDDLNLEGDSHPYVTQMVYIERLELCPIKVNVSFHKSAVDRKVWQVAIGSTDVAAEAALRMGEMDTSHLIVNGQLTSAAARQNPQMAIIFTIFHLLTDVMMPLIPSISNASIKLNSLNIAHVFQTPTEIWGTLQAHYTSNFLFQFYRIVGSIDIIGNPLSFASSLGTGVIDFFYEPAQGLVKSPRAFVRGVVKGTSSLVTNTTSGFLGVAGKISKSIGSGVLCTISKDMSFMRSREHLAREQSHAYLRPAKDFIHGIYHGVSGIVTDPYYGARKDGCRGLFRGLGYGLVGIVAKPIVGVLDAVAHTSDGFRDLAMVISMERRLDPVQRQNFQHTFASDGRLLPYDVKLARGYMVLQKYSHNPPKKSNYMDDDVMTGTVSDVVPLVNNIGGLKTDMGSAMAAVGAAGRTVFNSTRNVVSAVAGKLNITEARNEVDELPDTDSDEKVILTEIIQENAKDEILVVISTKRIVCVKCISKGSCEPEMHLLWQTPTRRIITLELQSTPLKLTFYIERSPTKLAHISLGSKCLEELNRGDNNLRTSGIRARLQPRHKYQRSIAIQKRLFGDWQRDSVSFIRIHNIVKCLLNKVEEAKVDMGYGFGVQCSHGGFQFGVWEFIPSRSAGISPSKERFPKSELGNFKTFSENVMYKNTNLWHLLSVLERFCWVDLETIRKEPVHQVVRLLDRTESPDLVTNTSLTLLQDLNEIKNTAYRGVDSASTKIESSFIRRHAPSQFYNAGESDVVDSTRAAPANFADYAEDSTTPHRKSPSSPLSENGATGGGVIKRIQHLRWSPQSEKKNRVTSNKADPLTSIQEPHVTRTAGDSWKIQPGHRDLVRPSPRLLLKNEIILCLQRKIDSLESRLGKIELECYKKNTLHKRSTEDEVDKT